MAEAAKTSKEVLASMKALRKEYEPLGELGPRLSGGTRYFKATKVPAHWKDAHEDVKRVVKFRIKAIFDKLYASIKHPEDCPVTEDQLPPSPDQIIGNGNSNSEFLTNDQAKAVIKAEFVGYYVPVDSKKFQGKDNKGNDIEGKWWIGTLPNCKHQDMITGDAKFGGYGDELYAPAYQVDGAYGSPFVGDMTAIEGRQQQLSLFGPQGAEYVEMELFAIAAVVLCLICAAISFCFGALSGVIAGEVRRGFKTKKAKASASSYDQVLEESEV